MADASVNGSVMSREDRFMRFILQIGVPSALLGYVIWNQTTHLNADTSLLIRQSQAIEQILTQHILTTSDLVEEMRRANLIALTACSQAAKNEGGVRACWAAAGAAAK